MTKFTFSFRLWILSVVSIVLVCNSVYTPQCRDPDMGGQLGNLFSSPNSTGDLRKFVVIGYPGGGVGNTLVFFSAAYYFGMFSSRNILIDDNSLLGEICNVLHCGFPLYSHMEMAFPSLFTESKKKEMRNIKVGDMNRYLR